MRDTKPFPSPAGQHVALDPDYLKKHLATVAAEVAKRSPEFDTFVGCGMGSIPWVVLLSITMDKPYVLVRKRDEYSTYTNCWRVVGRFGVLRRCLFVDDCVCSGATQLHVEQQLRNVDATLIGTVAWGPILRENDDPYKHREKVEHKYAALAAMAPG